MTAEAQTELPSSAPPANVGAGGWAWIPIPVLLLAIMGLWVLKPTVVHEAPWLVLALNFPFSLITCLLIAALIGRSFSSSGAPGLLLLGCGVILWGAAPVVATAAGLQQPNLQVTIHNTCVWISAACHLTGVMISRRSGRGFRLPSWWLAVAGLVSLGVIAVVTVAAKEGWMPVFFIQGQGGTPLREVVVGLSVAMFAGTALLLLGKQRPLTSFGFWYGLALSLAAVGLLGIMLQTATGTLLNWTGRAAQVLCGVYLLIAAFVSLREAGGRQISIELAEWDERLLRLLTPQHLRSLPAVWRYGLALALVVLVSWLRVALIPWLGTVAPYNLATLSTVIAAVLLGSGPGLVTLVLADLAVEIFVLGSVPGSFAGDPMVRLAMSLTFGVIIIAILHSVRVAWLKARRSAARLEAFASATFEGIVESEAGRVVDCNEQFARMFGSTVAEMRGMAVADLISPEDRKRVQENIEPNRKSVIEHAMLRKDGTRIVVEAHGRPVVPGSARRHTAVRDITARKQAEQVLRQTNEQLEQRVAERTGEIVKAGEKVRAERQRFLDMLDTLPVIVDIIRSDHRIEWANKAYQAALGDNTGKLCYASQFNRETPCGECEAFIPLKTGKPHHWEWTLPNGRTFDIYNFPFAASDGSPAVLEMDIDITEIRKAQGELREANATLEQKVVERTAALRETHRQLQSIIDKTTSIVYAFDLEERFVMANTTLAALVNSTPEQMIGKTRREFMPKEDAEWHEANDRKVIQAGRAMEFEEESQINGRSITWLTTKFPLRDAQGKIYAVGGISADISERKRAQEALQRSEEFNRSLVQNTTAIILRVDPQSRITFANKRALEFFGYTEAELIGNNAVGTIVPERETTGRDLAGMVQGIAADPDKFHSNVNENMRKNGERVWLEWTNSGIYDSEGRMQEFLSVGIDITERKRAEEALRQSEERYRSLFEHMLDGFAYCQILYENESPCDFIYLEVNGAFERLTNLKDVVGKRVSAVIPGIHRTNPELLQIYGLVARTGNPERFETYLPSLGIWLAISVYSPRKDHFVAVFDNITERKRAEEALRQSEELLRAVTDNCADAIYVKDRQSRWLLANPALQKITGKPLKEVLGKTDSEIYEDPEIGAAILANDARIMKRGEPEEFEERAQTADGVRVFLSTKAPRRDAEGNVIGLIGVSRDITERKRAEEALRQSEEKFRAFFQTAAVGAAQVGLDGRFMEVNDRLCQITGYRRDELLRMTPRELWHPDEIHTGPEDIMAHLNGSRPSFEAEKRYRRKDERDIWVQITAALIRDAAGKPLRSVGIIQDITARKRTEEKLAELTQRLTYHVDNSPLAVIEWGSDMRLTRWSGAAERVFGWKAEEVLGKRQEEFRWIYEEDKSQVAEVSQDLEKGKDSKRFSSNRNYRKDGSVVQCEWYNSSLLDGNGKLRSILSLVLDVTERKRAQAALQRSRDREELLSRTMSTLLTEPDPQAVIERLCNEVRKFLDCAVYFNFLLDPETNRLRYNTCGGADPRLARLVEKLELPGSLCGESARTAARVHAQNLGASDDPRSSIVRGLGIRAYAAHPLLGHKGEVIGTLSFGASNRDSFSTEDLDLMKAVADHVAVAMLRRRAEQALQESEARFRTLADSIPNLAWWANADGYITWYNQRWYQYTGTTPEEMEGWGWQKVHDPEHLPKVLERWKTSIARGEPFEMEFPLRGADGNYRWFLTRAIPLKGAEGNAARWFGTNTDVSDSREAREVLARSKEELEKIVAQRTAKLHDLVGELEHFSYTITHDMRAPLRAMQGFSQLMLETGCAECANTVNASLLKKIMTGANRMDQLITDALNYARIVRAELPLSPVDLRPLLQGMLDTYPNLQPPNVEVRLDGELPAVMGNEAALTQCFSNLLGNAVKFVDAGKTPKIRIWAEDVGSDAKGLLEHPMVRIWVEDNGIGIAKDYHKKIFEMFGRVDKKHEGTGIGLALVRKNVERMGGKLGVESEVGHGSRFWIELQKAV